MNLDAADPLEDDDTAAADDETIDEQEPIDAYRRLPAPALSAFGRHGAPR